MIKFTGTTCQNCKSDLQTRTFCPQCGFDLIAGKLDPELLDSLQRDWLREAKEDTRRVALNVLVQKAREQKDSWRQSSSFAMERHQILKEEVEEALQAPESLDFRSSCELACEQLYLGDFKKAFILALEAAGQGDPKGQCMVGGAFLGWGIAVDRDEAIFWLTKSAAQSHAPAQYHLGLVCEDGNGTGGNLVEAKDWFLQAARQGYPFAEFRLGELSYDLQNDVDAAFKWFERSAFRGFCLAQYNLGVMYEHGMAVDRNLAQAEHWWRKAAEQQLQDALEKLRMVCQVDL